MPANANARNRALCGRLGVPQQDVARKLGTYASYVLKCESGERRIDVVELADFCRVYGVGLVDFTKSARIR